MSSDSNLEEYFRKLTKEADNWPVECLKLVDCYNRWQGIFLIDHHLDDSKKKYLNSILNRLADNPQVKKVQKEETEVSGGVSAEERTLLFNFLRPSSGEG